MYYLILFLGWSFYFTLHSVLAALQVKSFFEKHFPVLFNYYRIAYNLLSFLGLILLGYFTLQVTDYFILPMLLLKLTGAVLLIISLILFYIAFNAFDMREFLGIISKQNKKESNLITGGIYQYVRHPLYTATIIICIALLCLHPTFGVLIFCLAAFVYLEIGTRLEEKKLIDEFGTDYTEYRKKVKKYFPYLY